MSGIDKIKHKVEEVAGKAKGLVEHKSDEADTDEAGTDGTAGMDEVEVRVADTNETIDDVDTDQPPMIR